MTETLSRLQVSILKTQALEAALKLDYSNEKQTLIAAEAFYNFLTKDAE